MNKKAQFKFALENKGINNNVIKKNKNKDNYSELENKFFRDVSGGLLFSKSDDFDKSAYAKMDTPLGGIGW